MVATQIRQARIEDSTAIAHVHVASWRAAYDKIVPASVLAAQSVQKQEAFWREALSRTCDNVLVAIAPPGEVVGWISFGPCRKPAKPAATGEIYAIYARPDHFRSGVGRLLWNAASPRLQAAGFFSVTARVLADNRAARIFYERVGFALVPNSESTFTWAGAQIADVCYEFRIDT
jgi:L-amino acid N-acyltransferase YncA